MNKIAELDLVKLSEFDDKSITTLLSKSKKIKTLVQFNEVAGSKPNASQKQICDEIGVSVPKINRIRKDLGVTSPYRYSVPTKTETQREKDKLRNIVNKAFKNSEITEDTKFELYTRINKSLDQSVKTEINKLKSTKKEFEENSYLTKQNPKGGGMYNDVSQTTNTMDSLKALANTIKI